MTNESTEARREGTRDDRETKLEERIQQLSQGKAYADAPSEVRVLQTRISVLFFAGERVYKLKKPVLLPFLDYRELEARRHACDEEVRLNRRISPSMYHGVAPITREADGSLVVDGDGAVVDWVVVMRRLPGDRMLSAILDRDRLAPRDLDRVVTVLARFHDRAPTGPAVNRHGLPSEVGRLVRENLDQLADVAARHPDEVPAAFLRRLRDDSNRFLADHTDLLARRVGDWRIREGHGDLHAGNICIEDHRVHVYDCVEYSRPLRCGDVASDLAMLAMDLDHRGRAGEAARLASCYAQAAGDRDLEALLPFYKAYRAAVRAKVGLLTAESRAEAGDDPAEHLAAAARLAQLAVGYRLPASLVLVGRGARPDGARAAAVEYVADRLRAARVRSEPTNEAASVELAVENLAQKRAVVVDAETTLGPAQRPFVEAAARYGAPLFALELAGSGDDARTPRWVDAAHAIRADAEARPISVGRELIERMVGTLA